MHRTICLFLLTLFPLLGFGRVEPNPNGITFSDIAPKWFFDSAHYGILIVHEENGLDDPNCWHDGLKAFIPASITKLFTTENALTQLGPSYTFSTRVCTSSTSRKGNLLEGNLYLVGGGDPTLTSEKLRTLASRVYALGIRKIKGQVIGDDSLYGTTLPPQVEWEDLCERYAPECSALTVNDNCITCYLSPNVSGKGDTSLTIEQEIPYCTVNNCVQTDPTAKEPSIQVKRGLTNNDIQLIGTIPANSDKMKVAIAVHDPALYATKLFVKALEDLDIVVENGSYNERRNDVELANISSPPLSEIIKKMNKESNNLTAELLYKATSQTIQDVEKILKPLLYDGSGLSRHNLASPVQTVKLLKRMLQSPYKDVFIDSLPVAGQDGTLANRFKDLPPNVTIQAKTGSMSGIANLAGYINAPSGRYVFAIFINNSWWSDKETQKALDEFLVRFVANL